MNIVIYILTLFVKEEPCMESILSLITLTLFNTAKNFKVYIKTSVLCRLNFQLN